MFLTYLIFLMILRTSKSPRSLDTQEILKVSPFFSTPAGLRDSSTDTPSPTPSPCTAAATETMQNTLTETMQYTH